MGNRKTVTGYYNAISYLWTDQLGIVECKPRPISSVTTIDLDSSLIFLDINSQAHEYYRL